MPQKKNGRGRPRRSVATGFAVTKKRSSRTSKTTAEPTSAFEALMQVTSAELERLNSDGASGSPASGDNQSNSSSRSFEENRLRIAARLSSPSYPQTLPSWYGNLIQTAPPKPELILPPKKKKYLHLLAQTDEDNTVTETPRNQQPPNQENAETDNSSPLRFNPTKTPDKDALTTANCSSEISTFSDLLDEHISRLISQNETIVSSQTAIVMNKRGRSRDSTSMSRSQELESPKPSTSAHTESMVKSLLSSKLTRKSMLAKEMAEQRQLLNSAPAFTSYLNPEKSAIKDLLIKTYEDKAGFVHGRGISEKGASSPPSDAVVPNGQFMITSDKRAGALVVPETLQDGRKSWSIVSGNEWVFVDDRGRKRVRPEVTVCPDAAYYHTSGPTRALRSPSIDSMVSLESMPSSASPGYMSNQTVFTKGTYRPGGTHRDRRTVDMTAGGSGVVKCSGIFRPVIDQTSYVQPSTSASPVRAALLDVESHEKALNALRGHLTGRRPTEGSIVYESTPESSMLPPKKRKIFHIVEKPVVSPSEETAAAVEIVPATSVQVATGPPVQQHQLKQEAGFSGYATYVNENHPSHLGFYSDLSRQYATNLAFAQTLLQQGHGFPSFRYSCVTTSAIKGPKPNYLADGESVYAGWNVERPLVDPHIQVDSSGYGKQKRNESYVSCATKRSAMVCATSVENYKLKRHLIMTGQNSFLATDAARLNHQPDYTSSTARSSETHNNSYSLLLNKIDQEQSTSAAGGDVRRNSSASQRYQPAILEDVSEDETEEVACFECGKKSSVAQKSSKDIHLCAVCTKSKVDVPTAKKHALEEEKKLVSSTESSGSSHSLSEKQLIAQRLQQKIIDHQNNGQHSAVLTPNASVSKVGGQDVMDLSVKKPAPAFDGIASKFSCTHCGKVFNKEAQLYLHSRVHDMETPGKADKRHQKQRREGSTSPTGNHTLAATNDNPRPFTCAECNVGFRIHGHLQKHLRSKGHITQLECLGKLPPGLYAELERQNITAKLHTLIDAADCGKAFTSLVHLARTVQLGGTTEVAESASAQLVAQPS